MIQRSSRIGNPENLTGDLDFFTVYTVLDIAEGEFEAGEATQNFAILVDALSVQPVLATLTSEEVDLSVADNRTKYGLGTSFDAADTVVNTYRFAIEHTGALGHTTAEANDVNVPYSIAARLQGLVLPKAADVDGVEVATVEASDAATKNISAVLYNVL